MCLPDDKDGIGGIVAGCGVGGATAGPGGAAGTGPSMGPDGPAGMDSGCPAGAAAGGPAGAGRAGRSADDGDAAGTEDAELLVWLEDGVEQPFESMTELRRPWLEESSSWGSTDDARRGLPDDDGAGPQEIIWL